MNNIRRKKLHKLQEQLKEILDCLDELKSEEETYLYNIPDNLQGSERYERAENAVSNLEDACTSLEDVISSIEEAAI